MPSQRRTTNVVQHYVTCFLPSSTGCVVDGCCSLATASPPRTAEQVRRVFMLCARAERCRGQPHTNTWASNVNNVNIFSSTTTATSVRGCEDTFFLFFFLPCRVKQHGVLCTLRRRTTFDNLLHAVRNPHSTQHAPPCTVKLLRPHNTSAGDRHVVTMHRQAIAPT